MKYFNTKEAQRKNKVLQCLSAMLMLVAAHGARAACTQTNVGDGKSYYTGSVSGVTPPQFNPNNYAVGQVIYRGAGTVQINNASPANGGKPTFICNPKAVPYGVGIIPNNDPNTTTVGVATNGIYPTSIPGIGLRMSGAFSPGVYFPTAVDAAYSGTLSWLQNFTITVEIVKTANTVGSGTLTGAFAAYSPSPTSGPIEVLFAWDGGGVPIQPVVPACTVQTSDIRVPMGAVAASVFTGPGSVGPTKDFSIDLNCAGGDPGTSVGAYVTLSDAANTGNLSTTLPLDATSSAQGVGIQILRNGSPVAFGPAATGKTIGNTNQWKAGTIAQGSPSFSVPLQARYIQTGARVNGGTANSQAVFTLAYQ